MKINKTEVKYILKGLETLDIKGITNKDNTLDIKGFNNLLEVKMAVKRLNKLGVTREWLMKHFTIAGMLISGLKH